MCSLSQLLARFSRPYVTLQATQEAAVPTRVTWDSAWASWDALRSKGGDAVKERIRDYMAKYTPLRNSGWAGTLAGRPLHLEIDTCSLPQDLTLRISLPEDAINAFESVTGGWTTQLFADGPAHEYPEAWGSPAWLTTELAPGVFLGGPPADVRRLVTFLEERDLVEPLCAMHFNGLHRLFLSRSFGRYDFERRELQHLQMNVNVTPSFKELDLLLAALEVFVQRLCALEESAQEPGSEPTP